MEANDEIRELIRREGQLAAQLRLATDRLEEAQQERIWAVVEAHQSGLSMRQIAAATGLSPSRVHRRPGLIGRAPAAGRAEVQGRGRRGPASPPPEATGGAAAAPKRLSVREEPALLRALLDRSPYDQG